jgi:hypothetical protein
MKDARVDEKKITAEMLINIMSLGIGWHRHSSLTSQVFNGMFSRIAKARGPAKIVFKEGSKWRRRRNGTS